MDYCCLFLMNILQTLDIWNIDDMLSFKNLFEKKIRNFLNVFLREYNGFEIFVGVFQLKLLHIAKYKLSTKNSTLLSIAYIYIHTKMYLFN